MMLMSWAKALESSLNSFARRCIQAERLLKGAAALKGKA